MDLDVERGWVDPKGKQGGWWGWSRNKEEEGMCEPERSPCGEGPHVSSRASQGAAHSSTRAVSE